MEVEGRTALVDVKYSSLNHADGTWRRPGEPPDDALVFPGATLSDHSSFAAATWFASGFHS